MTEHHPISQRLYQELLAQRELGELEPKWVPDEWKAGVRDHLIMDPLHRAVVNANPQGKFDDEPVAAIRRAHYAALFQGRVTLQALRLR